MKFQKTVDLWCTETVEAILRGDIVVQPGQWVSCGAGPKSRLVSVNFERGTFDVVHGGNGTEVNQGFMQRINAKREALKRTFDRKMKKVIRLRRQATAEGKNLVRPTGHKKMFVAVRQQPGENRPAWEGRRATAVAV